MDKPLLHQLPLLGMVTVAMATADTIASDNPQTFTEGKGSGCAAHDTFSDDQPRILAAELGSPRPSLFPKVRYGLGCHGLTGG